MIDARQDSASQSAALRLRIDPEGRDQETLLRAARLLGRGGLVIHPTETLYGVAADPFNPAAVERLVALKGGDRGTPFILLLGRAAEAHDLCNLKGETKRRFDRVTGRFWPGALTLVLPVRSWLRCPALRGGPTVGVRLSSHPVARQLAILHGGPITSTSANLAGQAAPVRAEDLDPAVAAGADLVLDGGPAGGGEGSTLLDLSVDPPRILRAGGIDPALIERALGLAAGSIAVPGNR